MVQIDLITGFLGSGKTTFLKGYAGYLMRRGKKIGILENDHGAVNVDMMLLQELEGENCTLEMVAGGCDADCHRRRFKTKLIAMGMCGYDRILVEPSGIFDVDEFFDVLYEEPLNRWYEMGNVYAIVDGNLPEEWSETSEFLLASQVARAGKVILSKVTGMSEEGLMLTVERINHALRNVSCDRVLAWDKMLSKLPDSEKNIVYTGDFLCLEDKDYEALMKCGTASYDYVKKVSGYSDYQSLYFMHTPVDVKKMKQCIINLMNDEECGNIFRVKGFLLDESNQWMEMNATKWEFTMKPIANGQEIIIVIGEQLEEEKIRRYLSA